MSQWMIFLIVCLICISLFFAYFIFTTFLSELRDAMLKKSRYAVGFIISKPDNVLSDDQDSIKRDVAALDKSIDKITDGISRFIVVIFLVVVVLLAISATVIAYDKNELISTDVASFFNGIATPILTFFTFSGMLIAIIMQHIQMKTTLIELKLSRAEMVKSNESFKIQADNAKLQKNNYLHEKFENNFYSLFNSFNKIIDAHSDGDEIVGFFKGLEEITEREGLEKHVLDYRSLISKVSAVNAQMLSYIREKSGVNNGDSNHSNESGVVVSDIDAQRYAELVSSYVSNRILILFVLDAIFNNKSEYLNDLIYYGFIERIDFKISCIALGKVRELMEIVSSDQVTEFLNENGNKGVKGIDFFEKTISFVLRDLKKPFVSDNRVPYVYGNAIEVIENSIADIEKRIVGEKYFGNDAYLIASFDRDFIFGKFNINFDELLKKFVRGEYYLDNLDLFKKNLLKIQSNNSI